MYSLLNYPALLLLTLIFSAPGLAAQARIRPADTLHPKAQRQIPFHTPSIRELQNDLDALLDNPDLANAFTGVAVSSPETGEILYRRNEGRNFIPASTLKLFTTAAALEYLGPDFHYTTRLYLDGTLSSAGEFTGNVLIRGSGDPTLSDYFHVNPADVLDAWATKLDSIGIRSIRGNIIGDDRYFDGQYFGPGWAWDDEPYPFSAQVNALSVNDNKVSLTISPGERPGLPAKITMTPENSYVRLINNIVTGRVDEAREISSSREQKTNIIELKGRIPADTSGMMPPLKLSVTVDNPTLYFLSLFRQSLDKRGIRFRGALLDADDWNGKVNYAGIYPSCEYISPPVSEIVKVTNTYSHNLCAEMLLKTLGKEFSGTGSFAAGTEMIRKFAVRSGISPENLSIVDGSGLSRLNLCSPQNFISLLTAIHKSKFRKEFLASLASPGEQGTLRTRMLNTRAVRNLRAKTGSMNSTNALTGYVTTRDGEILAFSLMINGYIVPDTVAANALDLICMRLASFSRRIAPDQKQNFPLP